MKLGMNRVSHAEALYWMDGYIKPETRRFFKKQHHKTLRREGRVECQKEYLSHGEDVQAECWEEKEQYEWYAEFAQEYERHYASLEQEYEEIGYDDQDEYERRLNEYERGLNEQFHDEV